MANDGLTKVNTGTISQSFADLKKLLADEVALEKAIAEEIENNRNTIREQGAKDRYNIIKEYATKEANEAIAREKEAVNLVLKTELDKDKELKKLKKNLAKAKTKEDKAAAQAALDAHIAAKTAEIAADEKLIKAAKKKQEREAKAEQRKADREYTKKQRETLGNAMFGKGQTLQERGAALAAAFHQNADGSLNIAAGLATMAGAISDFTKQLNQQINSIASYRTAIDTRLQGSKNKTING